MSTTLVVLENPKTWHLEVKGVEVVAARDYLIDPRYGALKDVRVFNLCRTRGYQTIGYYVSLLGTARGHRPLPSLATLQDIRQTSLIRWVSQEHEELVQKTLKRIQTSHFRLSIYFGRNLSEKYNRLASALYGQFPAPLLRAEFEKNPEGRWRLERIRTLALDELPPSHETFFVAQTERHLKHPRHARKSLREHRYEMAVLVNEEEINCPSNSKAIKKFIDAADDLGICATTIEKDDYGSIAEYDALFIRETTSVNHHTYRFSRRAAMEGLVVIDDPESILRCTNKVYQAEVFERHNIPCPKTMVVHPDNQHEVAERIGFPCVVKQPDSSFSMGVAKAKDEAELRQHLEDFFEESDLAVVQEFVPSDFDWRVGVLDGRALYGCKYHMAKGHWKIQVTSEDGKKKEFGDFETMPVDRLPKQAVKIALKAANLMGDGLYGVDVKEVGGRFLVMEVNDNPSIDAGVEDQILGDELYMAIMRTFLERLENRGRTVRR